MDTNNDGQPDTCSVSKDPTPDQPIYFPALIHGIHYGRRLGGFTERNNLFKPGALVVLGYFNQGNDFSDVLLPQDVRNCQTCHADSGATCSDDAPCGVGQGCVAGTCKNVAWTAPSAAVCLSCHDTQAASGHANLNTWRDGSGSYETCGVCHGPGAEFSVDKVHNISDPYQPPYDRTKDPDPAN